MEKNWIEVSETVETMSNAHGEVMILEAYIAHLDHMVQEGFHFEPAVKAKLQSLVPTASIKDLHSK